MYMNLSESFWIFVVTTIAGLVLACMKICYDSKCKTMNLCCIKIERDTSAELSAEHDRMEHGVVNNPTLPPPPTRQSIDRPRTNSE